MKPPSRVDALKACINMTLADVHDYPDGFSIELHPAGRIGRRTIYIRTDVPFPVKDVTPRPITRRDLDQHEADIGDDMYEQQRHGEGDSDIEPGRSTTKGPDPR